jgi:hypothetical protein
MSQNLLIFSWKPTDGISCAPVSIWYNGDKGVQDQIKINVVDNKFWFSLKIKVFYTRDTALIYAEGGTLLYDRLNLN